MNVLAPRVVAMLLLSMVLIVFALTRESGCGFSERPDQSLFNLFLTARISRTRGVHAEPLLSLLDFIEPVSILHVLVDNKQLHFVCCVQSCLWNSSA